MGTGEKNKRIQTSLTKMAAIVNKASSESPLAKSRGFSSFVKTINKLSISEPKPVDSVSDADEDSLGRVNYYIDLALNTFESIQGPAIDEKQKAGFFLALGETFETLGNLSAALRNYESLLEQSAFLNDSNKRGQLQYRIGSIYAERGDWRQAQAFLADAIVTLRGAGNRAQVVLAQIELAKIDYRKGDYLKAESLFQEALKTSDEVNSIRTRATICNHLGIIRRIKGEFELAYSHFHQALIEFQCIQDLRGVAETMNNLGAVHLRKDELKEAKRYFEKSHKLCQEIGYFALLAFVYLNQAEYYCMLGDYLLSANICNRALEYVIRLKNPIGIAKINMLFARIFWKSSEFTTAKDFYETAINLYEEYKIPLGLANCYQEYAELLLETGSTAESKRRRRQAKEIYAKLNIRISNEPKVKLAVSDSNVVVTGI